MPSVKRSDCLSKTSSFRKPDEIVNIRFYIQLVNESFRQVFTMENSGNKIWFQSLSHKQVCQWTWNTFWTMGCLSTIHFSENRVTFFDCPWLGNLNADHKPHLKGCEKTREGCPGEGLAVVRTWIKWQWHSSRQRWFWHCETQEENGTPGSLHRISW